MHPIGRIANPQEIANAVVWLLSNKASFVLGHTLMERLSADDALMLRQTYNGDSNIDKLADPSYYGNRY